MKTEPCLAAGPQLDMVMVAVAVVASGGPGPSGHGRAMPPSPSTAWRRICCAELETVALAFLLQIKVLQGRGSWGLIVLQTDESGWES